MLEYPFLTLCKYPVGFILQLGSTVCARSVKLLERVPNPDEPETRDFWWTELRMEIRSHARALGCNVVLGYTEITSISYVQIFIKFQFRSIHFKFEFGLIAFLSF